MGSSRAESLAHASRNGNHVFHRAGQLNAQHIIIGVYAEVRRGELFRNSAPRRRLWSRARLRLARLARLPPQRMVLKAPQTAGVDFRGDNRRNHFAHSFVSGGLEAFGGAYENGTRRKARQCGTSRPHARARSVSRYKNLRAGDGRVCIGVTSISGCRRCPGR